MIRQQQYGTAADAAASTAAAESNGSSEYRPGDEVFERIRTRLEELVAFGTHYLSSRSDSVRLSLYSAALWAALGLLGAVAGAGILVSAAARIVSGIAGGLAAATGQQWLGDLLTGLLLLAAIGGAGFFFVRRLISAKQSSLEEKYEELQGIERRRFGKDASQRSSMI